MKSVKAVIFDVDGVIVDSEPPWIFGYGKFLEENNIIVDNDFLFSLIGCTSDMQIEKVASQFTDKNKEEVRNLWQIYWNNHPVDFKEQVMSNVKNLFSFLKNHQVKIGVASSSEIDYVTEILKCAEVYELTDVIIGKEQVTKHKPEPDCYLKAAEKLEVLKENCLVVEDSEKGIEAGKRAGMMVVAKKTDWCPVDQSKADFIVDDLIEITKLDSICWPV